MSISVLCGLQRWWFELFVIGNKVCIVAASGKTDIIPPFVCARVTLTTHGVCVRGVSALVLLDRPGN
jgi:hypothetical protein